MAYSLPTEFSFSAFLSAGWNLLQDKWSYLLKVLVITFLASMIPHFFTGMIAESFSGSIALILMILATVFQMVVNMAGTKIILELTKNNQLPLTIETFLSQKSRLGTYIWANFLLVLRVMLGYTLFIIPGIIWSIQFQFVPMIIVDKNVTARQAFGISSAMTKGRKLTLFGYGILFMLINLLGIMALFIGILFTAPITFLAYVIIYRYLEKSLEENQ